MASESKRFRSWRRLAGLAVLALTFGRLFLALVFPWIPDDWRLGAVVAGGLSDLLDGWLSRRARVTSRLGQMVDPVADKLLVAAVLATLLVDGWLAPWQIPLVAFRDIVVVLATLWVAAARGRAALTRMPPSMLGKLATTAQFVFLVAVMYDRGAGASHVVAAFGVAAALSFAAGVGYLRTPPPGV